MAEHPNALLARQAWDAIARGDAEGLKALLAPDLIWRATAPGTPWVGEHRGADAAIEMLARVGEASDVFDAQLEDVLASDERVLLLFRVLLKIGKRRLELDYLLLARIAGARLTEIWTVAVDPAAIESFWRDVDLAELRRSE